MPIKKPRVKRQCAENTPRLIIATKTQGMFSSIGTPPVYSIPGIGLTTGTKPAAASESA
jgi:hypothetical protein